MIKTLLAVVLAVPLIALAQAWPAKSIRLVVPYPPGGSTDLLARTIGESVPGYVMPASWLGFFAPAGLPDAILKRLNAEIVKAVQSPEIRARLEGAGMPVVGTSSDEFARMVKDDIETFRKIIAAAGIKPE